MVQPFCRLQNPFLLYLFLLSHPALISRVGLDADKPRAVDLNAAVLVRFEHLVLDMNAGQGPLEIAYFKLISGIRRYSRLARVKRSACWVVVKFEKRMISVLLYSVLSVSSAYSVVNACKVTTDYTEKHGEDTE